MISENPSNSNLIGKNIEARAREIETENNKSKQTKNKNNITKANVEVHGQTKTRKEEHNPHPWKANQMLQEDEPFLLLMRHPS